ncbi:Ribosomal RNA small subunit methyltransferase E [Hyella patelloides LEGE 07179]|uniref:Ribosomal RNA small subunit methyltransferase E n=1 Tax=Hyella patelloides LEGE 07179 TaxID=945734 RepID=A0A563VLE3_9CYAN|nr:16S rRNA (uracil(1498)-N(3))-methyltransferase [Hyella patelloides]VEP12270.1 Ribosomal RNA small subunit methyltransferase E [Hyella patelloides LEGE 07179]
MGAKTSNQSSMSNLYRLVFDPSQQTADTVRLTKEQEHYLKRVLRFQRGDRFIVINGQGKSWLAELNGANAHLLEIISLKTELAVNLTLITALPKGNGYEQVLKCGTELGVSQFIPVKSDRSLLKPSSNKVDRWRKIVTEAAEQAEREIVPQIIEPLPFKQAITELIPQKSNSYICVARGDFPSLWSCLQTSPQSEIAIATGAEGGWTENEIKIAQTQQFKSVSLGKSILRAVTAPIAAATLVNAIFNENN